MIGKHSYKELERQRREEEILSVAGRMLVERGYASLNMDELAEVVGISKPTLYQHFKSKDELVEQVVLRSFVSMHEFLSQPLEGKAIERLEALLRRLLNMRYAPGSVMASLRPEMVWNVLRTHPGLETHKSRFNALLVSLVDQAKAQGSIDPGIPTPVVIHAMLCLQGALRDASMQAEVTNHPENLERAIDSIVRVFLYGVTPITGNCPSSGVTE